MTIHAPPLHRKSLASRLISAGCNPHQADAKALVVSAASHALDRLGRSPRDHAATFLVPGRIEFLGKHTDYCGGRSLLCTVDRGFAVIATPRKDRTVRIVDALGNPPVEFELDPDLAVTEGGWSNYAMTVARRVARNFPGKLIGADIAFASDLPPSAGMSSSSAMLVGFFLALSRINHLPERREYRENIKSIEDLAGYLGTTENGQNFGTLLGDRGAGTFGGSQDHTAILCSRPGYLRQYSFCPVRRERDVPLPEGYLLAVASSGVVAEKTGAARDLYNALSLSVRAIVERWRQQTGNDDLTLAAIVSRGPQAVDQLRAMLTETPDAATRSRLLDRLEQFIAEATRIIPSAADALAAGRIDDLGSLIAQSQDLTERLLKNQVPETIFLAHSARQSGAVAASAFGAGFGGSVWAMVPAAEAEAFLSTWRANYERQFPTRAAASAFFLTAGGQPALDLSGDAVRPCSGV